VTRAAVRPVQTQENSTVTEEHNQVDENGSVQHTADDRGESNQVRVYSVCDFSMSRRQFITNQENGEQFAASEEEASHHIMHSVSTTNLVY